MIQVMHVKSVVDWLCQLTQSNKVLQIFLFRVNVPIGMNQSLYFERKEGGGGGILNQKTLSWVDVHIFGNNKRKLKYW